MRRLDTIDRFILIGRALERIQERFAKALKLTYLQLRILDYVAYKAPATNEEIAKGLHCKSQTLSPDLASMKTEGLITIERQAAARGRPNAVTLTSKGHELLDKFEKQSGVKSWELFAQGIDVYRLHEIFDKLERRIEGVDIRRTPRARRKADDYDFEPPSMESPNDGFGFGGDG